MENNAKGPDLKEMLGEDIDKAVKETLSYPRSWIPTHDGLAITFGQYVTGPYAIGMPEAQIPGAT